MVRMPLPCGTQGFHRYHLAAILVFGRSKTNRSPRSGGGQPPTAATAAKRVHRPSGQRSLSLAGQTDRREVDLGVEVVLAGLIHYSHVPFSRRDVVGQVLVELAQLEVL